MRPRGVGSGVWFPLHNRDTVQNERAALGDGFPLRERPPIEPDVPDPRGLVPTRGDDAGAVGAEPGAHHLALSSSGLATIGELHGSAAIRFSLSIAGPALERSFRCRGSR
jgi:hypothetical protein